MLRALLWIAALAALGAAALLVPVGGASLWQRAQKQGVTQTLGRATHRALEWARVERPAPPPKARAKKPPPAERLTRDDRKALDELVAKSQ